MKLKDICEINPRTQGIADYMSVSFVPMPCVSEDGKIDTSEIRQFIDVKKGYTVFQENDVLFAKITPCMENGKGAIARGLMNGIGCGSSEFHVLRANNEVVCPEWIYYLTAWSSFRREAEKHMTGSAGQRRVPKAYLENYDINVPSLPEQTKQTEVLSQLQQIIDCRKEELQKLDELVKARFIELFGGADYPNVLFENVCVFLRNGASIKQTKGAGGYPITRIETLSNDVFNTDRLGYADITDLEKYQSYVLHHGDILISHINSVAYLGRAVQYRGQLDTPIIHGMNLLCARIADSYNPTYIEWFFKTPMAKEYISTITKKAVNQASITTSDLKKMQVPNPPKGLQDQFATFVEQIDKSKVVVQKALNEAQTLFDSLMQEYFG